MVRGAMGMKLPVPMNPERAIVRGAMGMKLPVPMNPERAIVRGATGVTFPAPVNPERAIVRDAIVAAAPEVAKLGAVVPFSGPELIAGPAGATGVVVLMMPPLTAVTAGWDVVPATGGTGVAVDADDWLTVSEEGD